MELTAGSLKILVFAVVIAISSTLLWFLTKRMLKRKAERFQDREDMGGDELYSRYYQDSGIPKEIVLETLTHVANATGVPVGKLRLQDRFDIELAPARGWEFDDGLPELGWLVQSKMKKANIQGRAPRLNSIDDLIRYIASLETAVGANRSRGT